MEYYNNTLCVSHAELLQIKSNSAIKAMCHRRREQNIQVRKGGGAGNIALYAVDELPADLKVEIYKRFPDIQGQAESKPFIESIIPDGEAVRFYSLYELKDGRNLPPDKQEEYANGVAILNAFKTVLEKANSHRKRQSQPALNKTEFWARAAKSLDRLADTYPHGLPTNPRRLQQKFNDYLKAGYETLISNKFLNNNAAKICEPIQESMLIMLLANHRNLDSEQIAGTYNTLAEQMGWERISRRTVVEWREKHSGITAAGRLGKSKFYDEMCMQVKRTAPTAPMLYWTLDGWTVELLYQDVTVNKKGHKVTTYHNRLTLEVVLDPCTKYPIGYAIGEAENPQLIVAALKDAVKHSQELFGRKYRVHQLQCDQYQLKALTPYYSVVADKLTPARVGNAKAKVIEPYFRYLNKNYCQYQANWSGFGVTRNRNLQPNDDALNALKKSFPSREECAAQIIRFMETERHNKRTEYVTKWQALPESDKLLLTDEEYLLRFGVLHTKQIAFKAGQGLNPQIMGLKQQYECFDPNFRKHMHLKWTVQYDPDDLSKVLAVNEDGTLRFMFETRYQQPMALAERAAGDGTELARIQGFNSHFEHEVINTIAGHHDNCEQLFSRNRHLEGTLAKHLICDSKGQHKTRRTAERLGVAEIKTIEAETVAATYLESAPLVDAREIEAMQVVGIADAGTGKKPLLGLDEIDSITVETVKPARTESGYTID